MQISKAVKKAIVESVNKTLKMITKEFNSLSDREKWEVFWNKDVEGVWICAKCECVLEDGPRRASPFSGCSIHCGNCDHELTRRTGGGQGDRFGWILRDD